MAVPTPQTLQELVQMLNKELGDEGIGTFPDVSRIQTLLENYKSNATDWRQYVYLDKHKYTRNLVDNGNGKFNLMVLCWDAGQRSPIHDHTNSHCLVKMLDGQLTESLYEWPQAPDAPLPLCKESVYSTDQVTYMHDKIGLHRMTNSSAHPAISLHLYSPPFDTCKTFCEKTGACRTSGKYTYHSINGQVNRVCQDIACKLGLDKSDELSLSDQVAHELECFKASTAGVPVPDDEALRTVVRPCATNRLAV